MPFLVDVVKRNMLTPQDKRVPKTDRSILIVCLAYAVVVEADLMMAIGRRGTRGLVKTTQGEVKSQRSGT
jgi:hypothetical protein